MIEIKNLSKTFRSESGSVDALKNISLTVRDGDIYGMIGMSGAGKSTLVRSINLLERPTEGQILIDGVDITSLKGGELRRLRRGIGMIFQHFNLLAQRSCIDNICFPLELSGVRREAALARARELLSLVGLPDKERAYPSELSGGQQQRIAIARALATDPKILLCDEATSALDPQTTHSILELIREINRSTGITVIVITHQMSVVEEICNRVAILADGSVAEEGYVSEVFSDPTTEAAKRLVYPEEGISVLPKIKDSDSRTVRLVFDGADATVTPLISSLALETGISANILYASTRLIGDKVYGSMLLGLDDDDETVARALEYINKFEAISAKEVVRNVA